MPRRAPGDEQTFANQLLELQRHVARVRAGQPAQVGVVQLSLGMGRGERESSKLIERIETTAEPRPQRVERFLRKQAHLPEPQVGLELLEILP
jgi:hypothetical protein